MTNIFTRFSPWIIEVCSTNETIGKSFNKLNTFALIGVFSFNAFIAATLGLDKLVVVTLSIPVAVFLFSYYLNYRKLHGLALILIFIASDLHVSLLVHTYKSQLLELIYIIIAVVLWFPLNNMKTLRATYVVSYVCFVLFGFQFKGNSIFEISQWPVSVLIYFVILSFIYLSLYFFLNSFKKNSLNHDKAMQKKNEEIEKQNELIKLNTKTLILLEKEKHGIELESKQKDMNLLNINNQMKIKMKNDLIKELQKLKSSKSDMHSGIQSIIFKLKQQIEEEKKINLLQENIDTINSDFSERIKNRFPKITKSDLELLSFIKLKLSNKQIAIQKNTSPNTINVALHRLKAKCNFDSTNELKDFIEKF